MSDDWKRETEALIATLEETHRALDATILEHVEARDLDELSIARLKKQKLKLKDQIFALVASLTPDVPA
jgi:hypothetical protein